MSDGPESLEEMQPERSNVRSVESVSPSARTTGYLRLESDRTFRSSYHAEVHQTAITRRDTLMPVICDRIEQGELIAHILKDLQVPRDTLTNWSHAPEWSARYSRARSCQADAIAEQVLEIADSASPEMAQVAKLQCDSRRWYAGKVAPRTYGDKVQVEHKAVDVSALTDAQLEQLAKGDVSVLDSQTLPHPQTRALPSGAPSDRSDSR